jgi:hypothetical protein
MWTISSSHGQKHYLFVEIQKKTHTRTRHQHTCIPTRHALHTPMHNTHARHAHPRTAHQHVQNCTTHAHHTSVQGNKIRAKEHNLFKLSFFGAGVVMFAKHISSAPKGESSSTVELQIGGAAVLEWVWWSRSPAKHALKSKSPDR